MTDAQHDKNDAQKTPQPPSIVPHTPNISGLSLSFCHRIPSIKEYFATAEHRATIEASVFLEPAKHPRLSTYRTWQIYKWLGGVDVSEHPVYDEIREETPEAGESTGSESNKNGPGETTPADEPGNLRRGDEKRRYRP